jgi:hypothetical protein
MGKTIRRNLVLKELDIKELQDGNRRVFSIRFIKINGESVFFPRAVASGLKGNMKDNRLRSVIPVDEDGKNTAHVYPVRIDNIIEFNGWRVTM